jgi:hypothetical protein
VCLGPRTEPVSGKAMMRIGNLVLGKTDIVFMFLQGAPKVVYRRGNERGHKSNSRPSSATRVGPAGKHYACRIWDDRAVLSQP